MCSSSLLQTHTKGPVCLRGHDDFVDDEVFMGITHNTRHVTGVRTVPSDHYWLQCFGVLIWALLLGMQTRWTVDSIKSSSSTQKGCKFNGEGDL